MSGRDFGWVAEVLTCLPSVLPCDQAFLGLWVWPYRYFGHVMGEIKGWKQIKVVTVSGMFAPIICIVMVIRRWVGCISWFTRL